MDDKSHRLEEFFKQKEISPEYKMAEKYFDESRCNEIRLIGPVATLCKESNSKNINDWIEYYKSTIYFKNILTSFYRIKNTLSKHNICFDDNTLKQCLQTFIFWKTWCGCLAEITALNMLQDEDFSCSFADKEMDSKFAVDIIMYYRKKIVMGIQVKPTSYMGTSNPYNAKKNALFERSYGRDVIYIYYDSNTKIFRPEDIALINEKKKVIIEEEKPEVIKAFNPFLSEEKGEDCYSEVSYIIINSWYKTPEEIAVFKFLAHLKEAEKCPTLYEAYKERLISLWGEKLYSKVKICYLDTYDNTDKKFSQYSTVENSAEAVDILRAIHELYDIIPEMRLIYKKTMNERRSSND